MSEKDQKQEALLYKGHPLMRKDNIIYYGSMGDPYIIMMQILDTTNVKDLTIATRVAVQLQQTATDVRPKDKIVKKTEKDGLWNAVDIASIWLNRALATK